MNFKILKIEQYKEQILNSSLHSLLKECRNEYSNFLNKGIIPSFNILKDQVFNKLQLNFANDYSSVLEELSTWYKNITELKFIHEYIISKHINEIIVHDETFIQLEEYSSLKNIDIFHMTKEDIELAFEVIALKNNVNWNYAHPFSSFFAKIQNTPFRITLTHSSISSDKRPKMFLRKIRNSSLSIDDFNLNYELINTISNLVRSKKNILISGATGSGKTTFLKCLIELIDKNEHIILLEDTHEIITDNKNISSLLSDPDKEEKNLKNYCAYSLRMRPDRIILGEMRSKEVVPFILAMNTGHNGLMATIHANSAKDALSRTALLFTLYNEGEKLDYNLALKLICQNINYVIHLQNKEIAGIIQVLGSEKENSYIDTIYQLPKSSNIMSDLATPT